MTDVYNHLARFLDDLPAGFPATPGGIKLKILRKLFTPGEAELCLHLTLLAEDPRVVAHRARKPLAETSRMLERMAEIGLILCSYTGDKPSRYAASQFVVGFWKDQVNRLDRQVRGMFDRHMRMG